jgi:hypothetical protein
LATDTVNVAGKKIPKTEAYAGAAVVVGVIAYAVIQKRKNAAAASQSGSPGGQFTDPAGNVCSAPNPETGFCPGTPEDISATEQLSSGSTDYGLAGGTGYNPGYGSGGGINTGSGVPTFTDNASWAQYCEQMLGSSGSDATAAAIAKYLNGQSLTETQVTTVEEAIAIGNYPPVSGAGGYPPSMHVSAGSNPPPNTVAVPDVVSQRVDPAEATLKNAGFKVAVSQTRKQNVAYHVTAQSPGSGVKAVQGSTVHLTIKQGA